MQYLDFHKSLAFNKYSYIILPNEIGQTQWDINNVELCCKISASATFVDYETTISLSQKGRMFIAVCKVNIWNVNHAQQYSFSTHERMFLWNLE